MCNAPVLLHSSFTSSCYARAVSYTFCLVQITYTPIAFSLYATVCVAACCISFSGRSC